jgi:hypothetical protein
MKRFDPPNILLFVITVIVVLAVVRFTRKTIEDGKNSPLPEVIVHRVIIIEKNQTNQKNFPEK